MTNDTDERRIRAIEANCPFTDEYLSMDEIREIARAIRESDEAAATPIEDADVTGAVLGMRSIAKHEGQHKGETELAACIEGWAALIERLAADIEAFKHDNAGLVKSLAEECELAHQNAVAANVWRERYEGLLSIGQDPATHVPVPICDFHTLLEYAELGNEYENNCRHELAKHAARYSETENWIENLRSLTAAEGEG